MKVGILSFDCEECNKHNELTITLKKLKEKVKEKKGIACKYCGANNEIPDSIKQQLNQEMKNTNSSST